MATTAPRDGQASGNEWNEPRRAELSQQIASGRLTVAEACARHGLSAELLQDWLRDFRRSAVSAFDESLKRTLVEQGANAAIWAAEFAGTLEEISVIDWVQTVEVTRKSAVIVVTHNGLESRVWCCNGAVVDAESGRLRGESALHRIVGLEQGRVLVEFRAVRRARTIYASTPSLLLEAAHRKDEAARLWRKLGDARRTYRVTEKASRRAGYSSQAERRLLESFQQPSSLQQVFARSELGDVETLTLLAQLSEAQLIAADPSSTPAPAPEGDAGDLSASSRTLTTLSIAPRREASPRWILPGWAWSGLAALALVTIVSLSRPDASSRSEEPGPQVSPAPATLSQTFAMQPSSAPGAADVPRAPAEPQHFVVATAFEPSNATITLDGQPVPSGALNTTLLEDGRAHELRAVAPGYAPTVVVFVDAPPPHLIRLESLPAAPSAAHVEGAEPVDAEGPAAVAARAESTPPVETPAPIQAEVVVLEAKLPRAKPRARERTKAPSIQTIEAATPAIRVIP